MHLAQVRQIPSGSDIGVAALVVNVGRLSAANVTLI